MSNNLRTRANFIRAAAGRRVTAVTQKLLWLIVLLAVARVMAQAQEPGTNNALHAPAVPYASPEPQRVLGSKVVSNETGVAPGPAAQLYRQLRNVGLDPQRVYHIRDASIERDEVHITLDDGTIGFMQAVDGRITGAYFNGDGEVLVVPPDRVERRSLGLFTGVAILEEKFSSAFFRFNDDTFAELEPYLRATEDGQSFIATYSTTVQTLAESDALRLLVSFINARRSADGKLVPDPGDRLLRARFAGEKHGLFDVFYDTTAGEQIMMGQFATTERGTTNYNIWTSFPMRSRRAGGKSRIASHGSAAPAVVQGGGEDAAESIRVTQYKIRAAIGINHDLDCDATLGIEVQRERARMIIFELSRYLKVRQVDSDGKPLEFLQNEALEGTALARRGNDVVAVIFPEKLQPGRKLTLHFTYAGLVLSDAGGGLMYVGARGIWYPNRGFAPASFDLEFRYPPDWTLVATGKMVSHQTEAGQQVAHWQADRPIPVAGFNLGHYIRAGEKAGNIPVEVYAARGVERDFPAQRAQVVIAPPNPRNPRASIPIVVPAPLPAPSSNAQNVAERVSKAVETLSRELGPYPYSSLTLSQMPGRMSQGWPTLVFLSSYSFLSPEERRLARLDENASFLYASLMPIHETAHQWWGDLVGWKTYRDQWLVEALANYCSLAALEKSSPRQVQSFLDQYRNNLLEKNDDGVINAEAGPVTLGVRLYSSLFPNGYDMISYGRGTWLFHMLRHMLRDAEQLSQAKARKDVRLAADKENLADEPFFRVLRKIRQQYEGKQITNRDVQRAFEEELPNSLRFEGEASLGWFFDEWVNGTAIPKLQLASVKIARSPNRTSASGTILQKEGPDELVTSVPIYAVLQNPRDPVLVGRVFADGPETSFRLTVPAGTRKLVIDPYQTVLARP